jgi:hypothetical protein
MPKAAAGAVGLDRVPKKRLYLIICLDIEKLKLKSMINIAVGRE